MGKLRGRAAFPLNVVVVATGLLLGLCGVAASVDSRVETPPLSDPAGLEAAVEQTRNSWEEHQRERQSSKARESRARSRTAYRDLSAPEAIEVANRTFPQLLRDNTYRLRLRPGERVARYISDFSAAVDHGVQGAGIVESTLPLRVPIGGSKRPVDLRLGRQGDAFVPMAPMTQVRIPGHLVDGIRLPRSGITVRPLAAETDEGTLVNGKVAYANVGGAPDTDLIAEATPDGAAISYLLRSQDSPEIHRIKLALPAGAELRRGDGPIDGIEVMMGSRRMATLSPPVAWGADREPVSTTYRLDGHDLVIDVDHRDRDVAYPVLVDPWINEDQRYWHIGGPYGQVDFDGWRTWENDVNNTVGHGAGDGMHGRGLYVYHFPGSVTYNRGTWNFQAPGHAYVYRYESLTAHAADYTTVQLGVWTGSQWSWTNGYDAHGQHVGTFFGPTDWWWSYGDFYITLCLSNPPCGAYHVTNGQVIGAAGSASNMADLGLLKWSNNGSQLPYVWAGGTQIFIQDDTPPSVAITAHNAPSGWVERTIPEVSATANDSGFGVQRMRLVRGSEVMGERDYPCTRIRPQRCEPSRSATFLYDSNWLPEGVNTLSVIGGDYEPWWNGPRNWSNPAFTSWQIKVDRGPPSVALFDEVWDERNITTEDGDADVGYLTGNQPLTIQASDAGSGVASVEMAVDGQRMRPEHRWEGACSPECGNSTTRTFTVPTADLPPGDHEVRVVVRDRMADPNGSIAGTHATVRTFLIHIGDQASSASDGASASTNPDDPQPPQDTTSAYASDLTPVERTTSIAAVQMSALTPMSDLNNVLGLTPYTVEDVGIVTAGSDPLTGRRINVGAVVYVKPALARAVNTSVAAYRTWPGSTTMVPFRATFVSPEVNDLLVEVDLATQTIVAIEPGPASKVTSFRPLPGQGTLPPPPEED